MVAPPSKLYTLSTVLFHKNGGANVAVKILLSHFSMFIPTKATVKLDNRTIVNFQVIGIIFCCFPNRTIIYPVVPVYHYQGNPYNTNSLGGLKFYVGFQKVAYENI